MLVLHLLAILFRIVFLIEFFAFEILVDGQRLFAMHASIDAPENLGRLVAGRADDLPCPGGQHADPEINDRAKYDT